MDLRGMCARVCLCKCGPSSDLVSSGRKPAQSFKLGVSIFAQYGLLICKVSCHALLICWTEACKDIDSVFTFLPGEKCREDSPDLIRLQPGLARQVKQKNIPFYKGILLVFAQSAQTIIKANRQQRTPTTQSKSHKILFEDLHYAFQCRYLNIWKQCGAPEWVSSLVVDFFLLQGWGGCWWPCNRATNTSDLPSSLDMAASLN